MARWGATGLSGRVLAGQTSGSTNPGGICYPRGYERLRREQGELMVYAYGTGRIAPVVDPGIPADIRQRLLARINHPELAHSKTLAILGVGLAVWIIAAAAATASAPLASTGWPVVIGLAGAIASAVALNFVIRKPDQIDRERFVLASELDEQSRMLMLRTQQAVRAVLGSQVYADHLLDHAAGESVLRRHEWEVASTLREITRLRAQVGYQAPPGPLTAAVLASHTRALKLAHDATTSRIRALENYARPVLMAEAAHRDWQSAMRASGLNDKYLDLVARTAADEHAIAELKDMTHQAAAAAAALRLNIAQAVQAAQPLVLP